MQNKRKKRTINYKEKEMEEPREPEGEFMKVCRPKVNQHWRMHPEKKNLRDPYAMDIPGNLPRKIAEETLVGHVSREISRFCTVFTKKVGVLSSFVRETKFQRSPLPQGGLEIPITLYVIKADGSEKIFSQDKNFVEEHSLEPKKIPIKDEYQEAYDDFA